MTDAADDVEKRAQPEHSLIRCVRRASKPCSTSTAASATSAVVPRGLRSRLASAGRAHPAWIVQLAKGGWFRHFKDLHPARHRHSCRHSGCLRLRIAACLGQGQAEVVRLAGACSLEAEQTLGAVFALAQLLALGGGGGGGGRKPSLCGGVVWLRLWRGGRFRVRSGPVGRFASGAR